MKKSTLFPLIFLAPQISQGALIASESFSYSAGALSGQSGGTGFSGGWGTQAAATVNATGLTYAGLEYSGGSANLNGNGISVFRDLTNSGGGSGSNVWLSFLIASPANNAGISFFDAGNEQTFAGRVSGNNINNNFGTLFYNGTGRPLNGGSNTGVAMSPSVGNASTHFFILNIDQTGASPVYKGWLDPDSSSHATGAAPTGGNTFTYSTATQFFDYTRLRLGVFAGAGGDVNFDELRLGDTWADVSPVPEPSVFLSTLLGGALLLRRKRS